MGNADFDSSTCKVYLYLCLTWRFYRWSTRLCLFVYDEFSFILNQVKGLSAAEFLIDVIVTMDASYSSFSYLTFRTIVSEFPAISVASTLISLSPSFKRAE